MKNETENPMRKVRIEKVLLSCGAKDKELQKAKKLLEFISGKKAQIRTSAKRIPDFDVRPGLEVGVRITLRNKELIYELIKKLLGAIVNTLYDDQIASNHFSFGISEYIDIPGIEYQRDIGIRGLNVTIVFSRAGLRTKLKKIKSGKLPAKQSVSKEEIIKFMEDNFQTKFG